MFPGSWGVGSRDKPAVGSENSSQEIRVHDIGKRKRLSAEGEIMGCNKMSDVCTNKAERCQNMAKKAAERKAEKRHW